VVMTDWKELFGEEWDYVVRLGSAIHDPEEKRAFWESLKEHKLADPAFSVYTLFPLEVSTNPVDKTEEESENGLSEKAKLSRRYCRAILATLRGSTNVEKS
jgi:hypothetical protein